MEEGFSADPDAPVYSAASIDIFAPLDLVWHVVSSVDEWPRWNAEVSEAALDGPIAEGTTFRWKAGPGTIKSTFRVVDQPHVLGWTGKTLGIPAVHVYRLASQSGHTRLTLQESWDGVLARLFRTYFQKTLNSAVETGLKAVKNEAERRLPASASKETGDA